MSQKFLYNTDSVLMLKCNVTLRHAQILPMSAKSNITQDMRQMMFAEKKIHSFGLICKKLFIYLLILSETRVDAQRECQKLGLREKRF